MNPILFAGVLAVQVAAKGVAVPNWLVLTVPQTRLSPAVMSWNGQFAELIEEELQAVGLAVY